MSESEAPQVLDAARDAGGRFVTGNAGGPGRPRRAVELTYLRALSDELTLEAWREIVRRAVEDAKAGDAQARAWVARYALGPAPAALMDLAIRDELGLDDELEVRAVAKDESTPALLGNWGSSSRVEQALALRLADERAEQAERQAAEQARKKAERQARAALQAAAAAELERRQAQEGEHAGQDPAGAAGGQ